MKKRRWYLIGNPAIRNKINWWFRVIGMGLVLGFACVGFGVFAVKVHAVLMLLR